MELSHEQRADAAEKTVEILKAKVRSLYNGSTSTVQRQLERARARQEENRQRQALMEVRNEELRKHSERLEGEVRERTRAIQAIVDNVTFGFLVIGRDLITREGYTRSCVELLGTDDIAGRSLMEVLGVDDARIRVAFELGIDQLYEDILPEEISIDQLPQRFVLDDGRILRVEARLVRSDDDCCIEGVLLTVSDATALEAAQTEASTNKMLINLLKTRDSFRSFLLDVRVQIETARSALARGDQATARRAVHTIKGNVASYGVNSVAAFIHDEENAPEIGSAALDNIEECFRTFLRAHHDVLELSYDDRIDDAVALTPENLSELRRIIGSISGANVERLMDWTRAILRKPAGHVLGPIDQFVRRLAERLDKDVAFELEGADVPVDVELLRPVFQNLTHVIRNALDHGVEPPGFRGAKPARALLSLAVAETDDGYAITVADDGRGVDVDRLVATAVAKGALLAGDAASLDPREKLELMFIDGLSTAEQTTEVSGRGVGMSALKAEVDARRGKIRVLSKPGEGTTFEIRIPRAEPQTAAVMTRARKAS